MADYGIGFLGIYLTAAELVGKVVTLTINAVTLEKVESLKKTNDDEDGGKMRDRWVLYFKESKSGRGLLLNRTNAECLKALWGRETENWLGHRITLFTQQVKVGPKLEPGIRVKGSPDISKAMDVEVKLPKRKAVIMTLLPTGKPSTAPAPAPEPEQVDSDTGEITQLAYTPTVADALALVESGQIDEAQDMARSLGEEDAAQVFNAVQTKAKGKK